MRLKEFAHGFDVEPDGERKFDGKQAISPISGAAMKRWFNSPDTGWQERAMGATLSVTFIGVTVLWVGALALH
jgi:hypothetical protein